MVESKGKALFALFSSEKRERKSEEERKEIEK